jgi:DNA-binding NarL/FixJ family response regulator
MPINVAIAADTPLTCQLLARALENCEKDFAVVGCEHTVKGFLKLASKNCGDVAVISATLEGDAQGGLKALRDLRAAGSTLIPILLLERNKPEAVLEAFSAGAKGVIYHTDPFEVVCKCIRSVCAGQVWANSQELHWILKALTNKKPAHVLNAVGIPLLTPRQEQIVRMVAEGLPNNEISAALHVTAHTVRNHLFRIYEKLGLSSRVELILRVLARQ